MEYPPCNLVAQFLPKEMGTAPLRRGGVRGRSPDTPQTCKGANPYLYRKPLALGARIKLTKTRTDYRVVVEMSVQNPYPASCRATHPQGSTEGGSPSGEGAFGPLEESFQGDRVLRERGKSKSPFP